MGNVPVSLVPRDQWVLRRSKVRPAGKEDPNTFFDKSAREWITMVFPSLNPSGALLRLPRGRVHVPTPACQPLAHVRPLVC